VIHYNGSTWLSHSIPTGGNLTLTGITVVSPTDVWVAGYASVGLGSFSPLIEHWNGSHWTSFQVSNFPSGQVYGIRGSNTHNVWAVGYDDESGASQGAVLAHWDGTNWTRLATPTKGQAGSTVLFAVKPLVEQRGDCGGQLQPEQSSSQQTNPHRALQRLDGEH
jgi:hypothetical protein